MSSPHGVQLTLGPLIAGTFSAVGYALHLTFLYFQIYGPKDEMRYKVLVLWVWLVDAAHTVFICLTTWNYAIPHFGDNEYLAVINDPPSSHVGNWNDSHASNSDTAACALILFYAEVKYWRWATVYEHFWVVRALSFVSSAVADIVISTARYYYLRELKQGYVQTREVVDTVMVFTINDGLLTSVIAITILGCSLGMHTNFVWIGLFYNLSPLFANSILATLNLRNWYRHTHRPMGISVTRSTAQKNRFPPMSHRAEVTTDHSEVADIDIQINKEIEYHVEMVDRCATNTSIPEPEKLKV
ncbi:hypothetical protein MVEN_00669800 [Mycena venus]|uniref:DUF6534 domain-containing protein n=1 Tax=Mycena venus TaxID=2733690 RepID=A0A8H6YNE0_9AGAR|nr:hypothetical protein MVEN_00669800 [Mycena venus]